MNKSKKVRGSSVSKSGARAAKPAAIRDREWDSAAPGMDSAKLDRASDIELAQRVKDQDHDWDANTGSK